MNKIFETHRFFKTQTVELLNSSILVKRKSLFDYEEFEIDFEHLENKKSVIAEVNHGLLVIAFLLLTIGLLYLFGSHYGHFILLFLVSIIIVVITFSTKKRVIRIEGYHNCLEFYFTKSNENEVRAFADEVINCSNNFLLNKYSKVDKDLPIENQLNNIEFLRNRNIINEEKFQELKNQLTGKESKRIGYMN